MLRRSTFLSAGLLQSALLAPSLLAGRSAQALPAAALSFPRDHGAHPALRTEWWYLTGYADLGSQAQPRLIGFQITFFRSRIDTAQPLQSRFAAKQLLFAHAAFTDIAAQKHWHDQRIARAGFGIAQAGELTTDVKLRDWTLKRDSDGSYASRISAKDFTLALQFAPSQAVLLQGQQGLSRKGPQEKQASYYYSQPQLRARGSITQVGKALQIREGTAWLDHEWSEEILHPEAVGWDWIGMNLLDGGSLTAFQLRRADGSALWAGGSYRSAAEALAGSTTIFNALEVSFKGSDLWQSPSSAAHYPMQWRIDTPRGQFRVRSLMPAQELDGRGTTGSIYWEGLADLLDPQGKLIGRGYLEMTGYAGKLQI
jgi:predicted secreted hydrolase